MDTIWKFPFEIKDDIEIEMPSGAEILCLQMQGDMACIWAKVSDYAPKTIRHFQVFGTGHPLPLITQRRKYIGTFQLLSGQLVFHLFELVNH
jgi:hypothetical protein